MLFIVNCVLLVLSAYRKVYCDRPDLPIRHLSKVEDEWYIRTPNDRVLRKIIARGRADSKGRICAIADNNKPYMFYRPPKECWDFVLKLPVRYNTYRMRYNGTDFHVRRNVQTGWRRIALQGVGDQGEHTVHVFDQDHRWYRFPNGQHLMDYVKRLPKTVACADNHRLQLWQNGTWAISSLFVPRALTAMGTFIIVVRSSEGTWYGMRNPPIGLRKYTLDLPKEIYDPYNFSISASQIYYPRNTNNTEDCST